MKCPRCGLFNPETAQRCDCGYDFETKTVEQSYDKQLPRLDSGAVLKTSLGLLCQRFPLYLGIVAIPAVFLGAVGFGIVAFEAGISTPPREFDPTALWKSMNWFPKAVIILCFLTTLALVNRAWAATVHATWEFELGHSISLSQAYRRVHRKSLRLLWLLFVIGLFTGPLSIVLSPLATVLFLPAVPVAVIESMGVRSSLSRSWALLKGSRIRVFLLILLYALVLAAVFSLFILLPPVPHFHSLPVWARPFVTMPVFFLFLLPTQWVFISLTLAYRNVRASRPGN